MAKPYEMGAVGQTGLDRIYNDPSTAHTLDLFELVTGSSLNEDRLQEFLDTLPSEAAAERSKLEQLMANPDTRVEADLSTRAGQMVWAAGLGFAAQNSKSVRNHPVWQTLIRNPQLSGSLGTAARYVDLSLTNRNATMNWGAPGSGFWFSPDKNHINLDLFHTLAIGFSKDLAPGMKGVAHEIGTMLHEIGHSQLTIRFTDAMLALKAREDKLVAEGKTRELTRDEMKQLVHIRTEFKLRHDIYNAAEDNCVDRYAVNQSRDLPYDIAQSVNVSAVTSSLGLILRNGGQKRPDLAAMVDPKNEKIAEAQEALKKLGLALALAFYTTNGLFDASDWETWKRLGINPADIKGVDGSDFNDLMKLCVGVEGMANLQPAIRDRWLLNSMFVRSVEGYADRRCKLVDTIWDRYAAPYAQVLIDAAEQNAENKMDQQQKSDGQNGQEQDSEQQGEKQSGDGNGAGEQENAGDPSLSGSPNAGNSGQSGGESQTSDVEGAGNRNVDSVLPATPEEARKASRRKSEEAANEEGAKTVRDLAYAAKQQERRDNAAKGNGGEGAQGDEKAEGEQSDDFSLDAGSGGSTGQRNVDLTKLSNGDWKEFGKRVNELEPVISRITDDFTYIRDQQRQVVRSLSKQREQLPRGGDLRQRLDMRAHMNLAAKRATGQKIEDTDLQRWKKDEIKTEPTSVELWILGDGSGSTRSSLADGGRRIDSCLQTMAILYEAGKRANFDVYAGVWENHDVRMLAEPGFTDIQIGENFEAVRQSGGVGTIYNTPIPQIINRLASQTTDAQGRPKRFAGMTHFLWILDGTENNLAIQGTASMISDLFRYGPAVSIDIAYLGGHRNCETKAIVDLVKKTVPGAPIDTLEALNAHDAPLRLVRKIKSRFEQSANSVKSVPDRVKREAFATAYKVMQL